MASKHSICVYKTFSCAIIAPFFTLEFIFSQASSLIPSIIVKNCRKPSYAKSARLPGIGESVARDMVVPKFSL
jgi:hypothetical protein